MLLTVRNREIKIVIINLNHNLIHLFTKKRRSALKRLKKFIKVLIWSHLIAGALLTAFVYYSFFRLPPKLLKEAALRKPFDVIIVPGVPFENKSWSKIMKMRVYWSYYLYKQGYTRNVIYSGGAVYTPFIESKIMALYGQKLGIPKENIVVETSAEHSTENIYYSYHLAKQRGFKSIALATDPAQSVMLSNFKNNLDEKIALIPVVPAILNQFPQKDFEIEHNSAKVENFISLVKREGFWERFKGTLGYKIRVIKTAVKDELSKKEAQGMQRKPPE